MGLKARFEGAPRRQIHRRGDRAAVELSARYINDRHLPDKAIDVIDEAGARPAHPAPVASARRPSGPKEIEAAIVAPRWRASRQTVSMDDRGC